MGNTFDSYFGEAGWDLLTSQFGETGTVTITPIAGGVGPFTVKAIFQEGRVLDPQGSSDPREPGSFGVLLVRPSDVSTWTPAVSDRVSIGSVNYLVDSIGELDPILELQIMRTT